MQKIFNKTILLLYFLILNITVCFFMFLSPLKVSAEDYSVTVTVTSNLSIGEQSGGGVYLSGESYTVSTTLVEGYYFTGWTYFGSSGGSFIEREKTFNIANPLSASEEYTYVANYAEITAVSENFTYDKTAHFINYSADVGYSCNIVYTYVTDFEENSINQTVESPIYAGYYNALITILCDTNSLEVGSKTIEFTINQKEVTISGSLESYVFDGTEKQYNAVITGGIIDGDTVDSLSCNYIGGVAPLFAGNYTVNEVICSNQNYAVFNIPSGYHIIITTNYTISIDRIINSNNEYKIRIILRNITGDQFLYRTNNNIIYSINDSSYYPIEAGSFSWSLSNDILEIYYDGRPSMSIALTENYNFQIGVADQYDYNDSTTFAETGSSLESGQVANYLVNGTAISNATQLQNFLSGTGNGYLTNNIYDFDWGEGGSGLIFTSERILDGNGYTIYFIGSYTAFEMIQPDYSFVSWKAWKASGLLIGINEGVLQNICFRYEGSRIYSNDQYNNANAGRAIGIVCGANTGTIRNCLLSLAGDFRYCLDYGNTMGFLTIGGFAGFAYNNSNIINCTIDFISGNYSVVNHANNTQTFTAFGGAVGFINGNGVTEIINGNINNSTVINCKIKGVLANILLEGKYLYGGALVGVTYESSSASSGVVNGVINNFFGRITADTTGYKGKSQKNIGMVCGFVSFLYNVYDTKNYTHIDIPELMNVPNSVSIGRDTDYFHITAFTGTAASPIDYGNFPADLISVQLPTVRIDTSVTPNVPMGAGSFGYYFEKLNDGNKAGNVTLEIIPLYNTFLWEVRDNTSASVYSIINIILNMDEGENIEDYLTFRWVYSQVLGAQIIEDASFGIRAYGTVSGVINGEMNYTYNGRNQREEILSDIQLEDNDGNPIEGYDFIVNAPFIIKDAGEYIVSFGNIISGGSSAGDDFTYQESSRSIIYVDFLNENSQAIKVIINPKDVSIYDFSNGEITKIYDGTDYVLYSAQDYLTGFTEVISEGEISPLNIIFYYENENINVTANCFVTGGLIYSGDPYSIIPYNYNIIGNTSFIAYITERKVSINFYMEEGQLPYDYFSKIYDGNGIFNKEYSLMNVVLPQDFPLDIEGYYYENSQISAFAGIKTLEFYLINNPYNNYELDTEQLIFDAEITPKYVNITYHNINQSYRHNLLEVTGIVNAEDIIEGDTVTATVDMSGILLTHITFTKYLNLSVILNTDNYYIDSYPDLTIRYFYFDEENNAYKIETLSDLSAINLNELNSDYTVIDYILSNNINGNNTVIESIETYGGNFNGNNMVISNVVLFNKSSISNNLNYVNLALFKNLASEGSIFNLGLADVFVNNYDYYILTSGIVAINYGNIFNCFFDGGIFTGNANSIDVITGGIAGLSYGNIENCINTAIIYAQGDNLTVGGIVGKIYDNANVINSIGFVEITLNFVNINLAGGIIGENNSIGTISGNDYLSYASLINNIVMTKAIGNDIDMSGSSYTALRNTNTALAEIIDNFVFKAYLVGNTEDNGTNENAFKIYNFRQMVLLEQYKWASFELNSDINYFNDYVHTPEKGVFSGSFLSKAGFTYYVYLPQDTNISDKILFEYEILNSITITMV